MTTIVGRDLDPEFVKLIDGQTFEEDMTVDNLAWIFSRLAEDFGDDREKMFFHATYVAQKIEKDCGIESARAFMALHLICDGVMDPTKAFDVVSFIE